MPEAAWRGPAADYHAESRCPSLRARTLAAAAELRQPVPSRALIALLALLVLGAPVAAAGGNAHVAALQVGLRARGLYAGPIDGVAGRQTVRAVRALQVRRGLVVDGIPGPRTRAALGRFGRPRLGSRVLSLGKAGWDVAALQFKLAWHGFPCAEFDGYFGIRTRAALRRFQRWAGLAVDGRAGRATLAALRTPLPTSPIALRRPIRLPIADRFGPRGSRFHAGIDFPAPYGLPVAAAGAGRVVYAGWHPSGYGLMVSIDHGRGVKTRYAHLARIDARVGMRVRAGRRVGLVGSTGHSTGPHLHFEVRVRTAAVDPLPVLR